MLLRRRVRQRVMRVAVRFRNLLGMCGCAVEVRGRYLGAVLRHGGVCVVFRLQQDNGYTHVHRISARQRCVTHSKESESWE